MLNIIFRYIHRAHSVLSYKMSGDGFAGIINNRCENLSIRGFDISHDDAYKFFPVATWSPGAVVELCKHEKLNETCSERSEDCFIWLFLCELLGLDPNIQLMKNNYVFFRNMFELGMIDDIITTRHRMIGYNNDISDVLLSKLNSMFFVFMEAYNVFNLNDFDDSILRVQQCVKVIENILSVIHKEQINTVWNENSDVMIDIIRLSDALHFESYNSIKSDIKEYLPKCYKKKDIVHAIYERLSDIMKAEQERVWDCISRCNGGVTYALFMYGEHSLEKFLWLFANSGIIHYASYCKDNSPKLCVRRGFDENYSSEVVIFEKKWMCDGMLVVPYTTEKREYYTGIDVEVDERGLNYGWCYGDLEGYNCKITLETINGSDINAFQNIKNIPEGIELEPDEGHMIKSICEMLTMCVTCERNNVEIIFGDGNRIRLRIE